MCHVSHGSKFHFMIKFLYLCSNVTLLNMCCTHDKPLGRESSIVNTAQFYFCNAEHHLVYSVEHNAEYCLKSTLKNYACTFKFDMNTAAKSIFLHVGGNQMTWVREEQPYPNHLERFDSATQVLCDKGFTRRHYWEAPWVDVAVATGGIRRRAGSHVCGCGYTDQSWCLYCSEDHYSARHDHWSVEIPAPPSHSHRVGVYLDWPGGTLSFYSVSSGTLSHLHTFHSTFTEPLYPGFGMQGEDCSVIICPARAPQLISRSASAERVDEF